MALKDYLIVKNHTSKHSVHVFLSMYNVFVHMYIHVFMHLMLFCREPLPGHWDTDLDSFQKMLVLKCIRLDKLTNAMQDFVATQLGQRFIEPQTADLSLAFKDSSPTSALIFILSTVRNPR